MQNNSERNLGHILSLTMQFILNLVSVNTNSWKQNINPGQNLPQTWFKLHHHLQVLCVIAASSRSAFSDRRRPRATAVIIAATGAVSEVIEMLLVDDDSLGRHTATESVSLIGCHSWRAAARFGSFLLPGVAGYDGSGGFFSFDFFVAGKTCR